MSKTKNNPPKRRRVGLIYDERMCAHNTPNEEYHPENPNRIRAIWDQLNTSSVWDQHNASGLTQRCVVLNADEAEDNQLALVHSKKHIDLIKTISSANYKPTIEKVAAKYDSIYFNGGSSEAANLAAGSVIKAAVKVAKGELDSAFAIVRPPGHHAEEDKPMGFCLYNNVAIAASFLLNEKELGIGKILIVDWDVHHGNGTQKMFYNDPRVLFFSVHRHENGSFYPGGNDGSHVMIGEGPGAGYNINVPWENGWCGDSDYLAVWDHILIPVAKKFDPDMIIISAGFDAAISDPIGGCCVTPDGYSMMLDKLMGFARGKIVMALEGGYNPNWLAQSVQTCVETLLQDKPRTVSSDDSSPLQSTWRVIQTVRQELWPYWPVLAGEVIKDGPRPGTSNLQANTEVGKDHSAEADFDFCIKESVISRNGVQSHSKQNRGSSSTSQAQPSDFDNSPPLTSNYDSVRRRLLPSFVRDAPPWTASSSSLKRPRLTRAHTSYPLSPGNKFTSLFDDDDDDSTLGRENVQSPVDEENVDLSTEMCMNELTRSVHTSRLTRARTPLPLSRDDKATPFVDDDDDDYTRDRENVQSPVDEENVDYSPEMSANELTRALHTNIGHVFSGVRQMSKLAQYHEGRATELEKKLQASEKKVARLKNENKKLKKSLDREIITGKKFLKSESGMKTLNEAKKEGVDEFKKSQEFRNEMLNAAENVYNQAIKACREMAYPK